MHPPSVGQQTVGAVGAGPAGLAAAHPVGIVGVEVAGDRDDLAVEPRVAQGDVHGAVAAHREPGDGPVPPAPGMGALHRPHQRVGHEVLEPYLAVDGVGPLGVRVDGTPAVGDGDDERTVPSPEGLVEEGRQPDALGVAISTGVAVKEVHDGQVGPFGGRWPVDPDFADPTVGVPRRQLQDLDPAGRDGMRGPAPGR
ncbi:MAG TPA: hypothetical protein VGF00_17220 [Acidimicrobiia bacterium]